MFKKIRAERFVSFLLIILTMFSFIYWNTYIAESASGREAALKSGKELYGAGQVCVCPKQHVVVEPIRKGDKASTKETVYNTLKTTTTDACEYTSPSTLIVPCNQLSGSVLMKKYIDAGIIKSTDAADTFVNNASAYALMVQNNLSTRTQNRSGVSGRYSYSDLGNGRFQRAMFDFNNNAHFVYSFLIGFAFITSMFVFIMIFMKITWLPDHPIKRREAMEDIVTSGVAVILTGGVWTFISLFQSIFDRFWSTYAVYSKDWLTVGNMFLYEYKGLVIGVLGIAALTSLLMLIKNFIGLSFSGDNPSARKQKMISILLCGIGTAGLGGLAIFMGFFWNMLK